MKNRITIAMKVKQLMFTIGYVATAAANQEKIIKSPAKNVSKLKSLFKLILIHNYNVL